MNFYKIYLVSQNKGTSTVKCNIYFSFFISHFKVCYTTYCALCWVVVKQHIKTTGILFNCHNNYLLTIVAPLFKAVTFNVTIFDVVLFDAVPTV